MFFSDSGMASYCVGGGCECVVWVWLHIPFRPTWHGLILLLVQGHLHVVILLIPFVVFGAKMYPRISHVYIIHTCQPIQLGNTRSMERLRIFLTLQSKFDPLTLVSSILGLGETLSRGGQPTAESVWGVCGCMRACVCVCVCVCVYPICNAQSHSISWLFDVQLFS